MKFLFNNWNIASLDLNFFGMVVSMADGVAFIFNNLFSFGEVQNYLSNYKIYSLNSLPLWIFFINSESSFNLNNSIVFDNKISEILVGISLDFRIVGGLLWILCLIFINWGNSSIDNRLYKKFCLALIIYSIVWGINCVLSKRLTNVEGGSTPLLDYVNNLSQTMDFNYVSKFSFFILFCIPFIFFMYSFISTVYGINLLLNKDYEFLFTIVSLWLATSMFIINLYVPLAISKVDGIIFNSLWLPFFMKMQNKLFLIGIFSPIVLFCMFLIIGIGKYFNFKYVEFFNTRLNSLVLSYITTSWFYKFMFIIFTSLIYTFIISFTVYLPSPWNWLFVYFVDCLAVLSTMWLFPVIRFGGILSGAAMSKSSNQESSLTLTILKRKFSSLSHGDINRNRLHREYLHLRRSLSHDMGVVKKESTDIVINSSNYSGQNLVTKDDFKKFEERQDEKRTEDFKKFTEQQEKSRFEFRKKLAMDMLKITPFGVAGWDIHSGIVYGKDSSVILRNLHNAVFLPDTEVTKLSNPKNSV